MQTPAFDMVPLDTEGHALWVQGIDADGAPAAITSAAVEIFDDADREALSLSLTPASVSGRTGLMHAPLDVTAGNGFERGKSYLVRWTGSVDGTEKSTIGKLKVT